MANVLQKRLFTLPFLNRLYGFNQLKNIRSRNVFRNSPTYTRSYDSQIGWLAFAGTFASGAATVYWLTSKYSKIKTPFVLCASTEDENVVEIKTNSTLKQMKFDEYASYEYGGKRLMSPKEFLDYLVDNKDSSRARKKILTTQDVNQILNSNQRLPKNKEDLFAYMGENGIITYPEYLFLLSLLTKSSDGLQVAFRMLDLDGNESLGKTEFEEVRYARKASDYWKRLYTVPMHKKLTKTNVEKNNRN